MFILVYNYNNTILKNCNCEAKDDILIYAELFWSKTRHRTKFDKQIKNWYCNNYFCYFGVITN